MVKENGGKGKLADRRKGLDTTTYTTKKLTKGKTYWWRAFACNAWGCGKSAPRTFTIE